MNNVTFAPVSRELPLLGSLRTISKVISVKFNDSGTSGEEVYKKTDTESLLTEPAPMG